MYVPGDAGVGTPPPLLEGALPVLVAGAPEEREFACVVAEDVPVVTEEFFAVVVEGAVADNDVEVPTPVPAPIVPFVAAA